jgi:hypothetical protein
LFIIIGGVGGGVVVFFHHGHHYGGGAGGRRPAYVPIRTCKRVSTVHSALPYTHRCTLLLPPPFCFALLQAARRHRHALMAVAEVGAALRDELAVMAMRRCGLVRW